MKIKLMHTTFTLFFNHYNLFIKNPEYLVNAIKSCKTGLIFNIAHMVGIFKVVMNFTCYNMQKVNHYLSMNLVFQILVCVVCVHSDLWIVWRRSVGRFGRDATHTRRCNRWRSFMWRLLSDSTGVKGARINVIFFNITGIAWNFYKQKVIMKPSKKSKC